MPAGLFVWHWPAIFEILDASSAFSAVTSKFFCVEVVCSYRNKYKKSVPKHLCVSAHLNIGNIPLKNIL